MKGDRDKANDLAQEVFMNIWNALEGFRSESSYKTWIYRITVNTCLQQIRNDNKNVRVPIEHVHVGAEEKNDHDEENYDKLYQAIGQLSEVDRLVIMMVLEDLEYTEISKMVGITENNLRVKIHRIKERLKKLMEDD
jgi:RNA polymerase sigma-70 factor (ECF subfamily)